MTILLTMCLILKNGLNNCLEKKMHIYIRQPINKDYKLHLENTRSGYY